MERQREMHVHALNEKQGDRKRGTDRLAGTESATKSEVHNKNKRKEVETAT